MKEWFETFFSEKKINNKVFRISDGEKIHVVDCETIKQLIVSAPYEEQRKIKLLLIRLDFHQRDIAAFLKHLATLYVENNSEEKQLVFGTRKLIIN